MANGRELVMAPWVRAVVYAVQHVGFPIVVAGYLLLQLGPQVSRVQATVERIAWVQERILEELRRANR